MRSAFALATSAFALAASAAATAPTREIVFVGPYNGVQTNVLAIHPDGRGLRLVAANASNPRWSPDGSEIVFTTFAREANGGFTPKGLAIVAAQGGTPRQITTGEDGTFGWAPNGHWIGFIRFEDGKSSLNIVHPDGTGEHEIVRARSAMWAPDSTRLLIELRQGLEIVDLAGRVHALPHAACAGGASWSPNGRWIAFSKCFDKPWNNGIVIEHPDGTGFRWLARTGSDNNPAWSHDSTKLAYVHFEQVDYLEHTEIRMITIDGKKLGNLDSYAQDHDEYPAWSPDGKQIAFDRDAALEPIGEADRLYVGDAKTGRVRKLYDNIWRGNQFWRPR